MPSDSDDDDNAHLGTPLEDLEEGSAAKRRPLALQDQTVRDAQGRQRFHGAFTGGFSAGFFNTVGSRDGFQPQAFVSSRVARADRAQAKPEDFMDEEDRGEHGIAPQRVQAKPEFQETRTGGAKRKHPQFDEGAIPGDPVLEQLVKPVRDTVGVRILKSMGWRPGQGIGPRVTRAEKKRAKKVYGCARPPDADTASDLPGSDSGSDSDSALREVLLAPDDAETPLVRPKHDLFGLGYSGLERRSLLGPAAGDSTLRYRDAKGKLAIKGQAFGVGAFEEQDEDIYTTEDMSNYEFEEPTREAGGPSRPAAAGVAGLVRVLAGFHMATARPPTRARYPPPPLPAGFRPEHRARASRFEPVPAERRGLERHRLTADQRGRMIGEAAPDAGEPGGGGERLAAPDAGEPGGGGEKLAAPDVGEPGGGGERLAAPPAAPAVPGGGAEKGAAAAVGGTPAAVGDVSRADSASGGDTSHLSAEDSARLQEVRRLLAEAPTTAAPTLKPFAPDPDKQRRYEQFLTLCAANRKDHYRLLLPASLTSWAREREVSEFGRAAQLFRPLAASLADRFVSAGTSEQEASRPGPAAAPADPAAEAARRSMFGALTRRRQQWRPAALLCRRFNVKDPFPQCSLVGTVPGDDGAVAAAATVSPAALEAPGVAEPPSTPPPPPAAPLARLAWDRLLAEEAAQAAGQSGQVVGTVDPQVTAPPPVKTTTADKPPADLFKAIFDNSSSDSEADADPEVTSQTVPSVTSPPPPPPPPMTSAAEVVVSRAGGATAAAAPARPTAAAFFADSPAPAAARKVGVSVFDNVDLDALNSWRHTTELPARLATQAGATQAGKAQAAVVGGPSSPADEYGPRLPPRPSDPGSAAGPRTPAAAAAAAVDSRSESDDGRWRERLTSRSGKKKKKHKKSAKKRKKSKRRGSDDSDSSDVDCVLLAKLREVSSKKSKNKSRH